MPRAAASSTLHLHEEILLLALKDDKGTIESKAGMYTYSIGGAMLTELLLEKRVRVGEDKKKLVDVVSPGSLGDPLLDEALQLVATSRRRRSAVNWVTRFANMKKLKHRIAQGLCRRGILKDSEDKILAIFARKIYPTIDPLPERRLVERLNRTIFDDAATVAPRTAVLVALTQATGLLAVHFPKKELRRRKQRLDAIANGDLVGRATREAVQAAQAAAMAMIAAASVATTASSSH